MPERDANQLAADVLDFHLEFDPKGIWWPVVVNAAGKRSATNAEIALWREREELVGLVGTLQQERDYLRDRGDKNARRAQAAEARAEALQQERDEARVDFDIAHQEYVEEATAHGATRERAEAAEAARDITLIPDGEGEAVT